MKELKKALTYNEQIDKLEKEHGLVIEDRNQAIGEKYWKQSKEVN